MKNSGKIWPYAIGLSIVFIFGACVATIVVASTSPVEKSDTYMMGYHEADAKANELIKSRIDFDKKYKVEYITGGVNVDNTSLKYRVSDINSKPVNDATLKVVMTRPDSRKFDLNLNTPSIENGIYTFSNIKLPKEGRWDVIAKINIGENERFYNVKTDTRNIKYSEY